MHDINRIRQIVEDKKIWLDENDTMSIKVWATWLQQVGTSVILKDKIDSPPLLDLDFPQIPLSFAYRPLYKKSSLILLGKIL